MLPKLPVPDLRHTLDAYLRSVKHLVPEAQLLKTHGAVETFSKQEEGERLQNCCWRKETRQRTGCRAANILRFIIKVQ